MPTPPHQQVLTRLATELLGPAGLVRRGRSRTWLDDHGWWVGVVTLEPSGFSRGTHLTVGVTWPFSLDPDPDLVLDDPRRVGPFVPDESDDGFAAAVEGLLRDGLGEVERRRRRLSTPGAAAEEVGARAGRGGWPAWDAACLHGLAGDASHAARLLDAVVTTAEDRAWWAPVRERAAAWRSLADADPLAFRGELAAVVRASRAGLGLAPHHPALAGLLP